MWIAFGLSLNRITIDLNRSAGNFVLCCVRYSRNRTERSVDAGQSIYMALGLGLAPLDAFYARALEHAPGVRCKRRQRQRQRHRHQLRHRQRDINMNINNDSDNNVRVSTSFVVDVAVSCNAFVNFGVSFGTWAQRVNSTHTLLPREQCTGLWAGTELSLWDRAEYQTESIWNLIGIFSID